jgi:hypothetical protein
MKAGKDFEAVITNFKILTRYTSKGTSKPQKPVRLATIMVEPGTLQNTRQMCNCLAGYFVTSRMYGKLLRMKISGLSGK